MDRASQQGFERTVVFLGGVAVQARAVGEELGGILKGLAEEFTGKPDVGRGYVARNNGGGLTTGFVRRIRGVMRAILDGCIRVVQLGRVGESESDVAESLVEFKDLCSVKILRVLSGGLSA